ncbi:S-layer protein (TIGR01567 family) [Methanohalophilus levihalophilus]|uniref:S-layer protein domain-containing protein n=1 Tax=Methanohalophilus levihalophilus TaxID=1431282 RepID=UPI001AE8A814|nr:S-layer protein domain-containing protein [Methanohalophilus levihalophilus]MBP2030196.1 S-layer protein (TIGR01567 family) [Methanohalophilus levihalophilus]
MNSNLQKALIFLLIVGFGCGVATAAAPIISGIDDSDVDFNSATIEFTVDQNNATTQVAYSINSDLSSATWTTNTTSGGNDRSVLLPGLTEDTTYYYSIYAYNTSNVSEFTNSTIDNFDTLTPTAPTISSVSVVDITATTADVEFDISANPDADNKVVYSENSDLSAPFPAKWDNGTGSQSVSLTGLTEGTTYYYQISSNNTFNSSLSDNTTILSFQTVTPTAPLIENVEDKNVEGTSATIEFDVNQSDAKTQVAYSTSSNLSSPSWTANVTSGSSRTVSLSSLSGETTYYYSVFAYNASNNSVYSNSTIASFTTLSSWGNRIWDENEGLSNPYTWDAKSFSGFFYDLDTGDTSESMTITIDVSGREIKDGDLVYTAIPITTEFEYSGWDDYDVIGFMAEKYFAGYNNTDTSIIDSDLSLMEEGILAKVLIDTDDDESIYSGSSLILEDGYALNIQQVDVNGDSVWMSLTKDGDEIDDDILSAGETYVYTKDMGGVDDVPIIAVHFDEVFSGTETNAVFVDGIFQISDEYTEIDRGDEFGKMEITDVDDDIIEMENEDDIDLDEGDIIEIMGKLNIIVADDSVLRFAPFVDMSEPGTYELRGTIATENDGEFTWTPLNFEGFYYDIDEGLRSETLKIDASGGRNLEGDDVTYTAVPVTVEFEHSQWGDYKVIGFMAEKYFAAFVDDPSNDWDDDAISLMQEGQLSKVLIDDDDDRSVYTGSSLILEEGYTLNIKEVNVNGDSVWLELTKDGDEVEEKIISANDDFVYVDDVSGVDDVPLIVVHFDEVFSGTETSAVFVEGIFQISDDFVEIEKGDDYGKMTIDDVGPSSIEMELDDDIELDDGDTIELMGDIQIKVADDNTLRYYPFVEVETKPSESLNLDIEPTTVLEDDEVLFTVTSRGSSVRDAIILVDGVEVGDTDREGTFEYEFDDEGTYTITAEKEGFTSDEGKVEVISPEDESKKITIEVSPEEIFEGTPITISVLKAIGSEPIEGAEVYFDSKLLGETDDDGTISYNPKEPGMHKIKATISGLLDSELNIQVQELAANFVFSEFEFSSNPAKVNKEVTISLNAVNDGYAEGSYTVELSVNNEVLDSEEITLAVNDSTEIELTFTPEAEGTYFVEAGGFSETLEVEKGIGLIWYAAGAGALALAGGAIYLFTQGGGAAGLNGAIESIKEMISGLRK